MEKANMKKWILAGIAVLVLSVGQWARAEGTNAPDSGNLRGKAFDRLDANHDGVISKEEWAAAAEKRRANQGEWLKKHPELMKKIDTNGDGVISDEEREAAWKKWQAHRQQMLEKYDANRDGQLSPEEHAAMRAEMRTEWEKAHPEIVKQFDKNGNGTLDPEERDAAWQNWKTLKQQDLPHP
jgi:Ca2+-binding EF-hand superfamily protein